ncbi:uncharacterized protein BO87DRAFT_69347 [Aspergillus neoniger CBS 115656]|uniref:Uncharacterized protein n=1 Tax=Aspergillus neoniger (strain CBS 115656) TaxID=1448310 RepID=A0A318YGA4_ASPNB|nr:hypothetical protein BO87DRAFT_69347 [Aspergillus neoniger CBS 115656]PYH33475.1 hypothetical protein BO87DRAFT_69347 [Aspergillus neoniger CBS 115656]
MRCKASINSLLRLLVRFTDILTLRITWTKLAGDPPILNRSTTTMPDTHAVRRVPNITIHKANKPQPFRQKLPSCLNLSLPLLAPSFSLCIKRSVRKYPISSIVSRLYLQRSNPPISSRKAAEFDNRAGPWMLYKSSFVSYPIWVVFPAWRMVL